MNIHVDLFKFVFVVSLAFLVLSGVFVVVLGLSDKLLPYVIPTPSWSVLVAFAVLWLLAMKAAYWWFFGRYTFYGAR